MRAVDSSGRPETQMVQFGASLRVSIAQNSLENESNLIIIPELLPTDVIRDGERATGTRARYLWGAGY